MKQSLSPPMRHAGLDPASRHPAYTFLDSGFRRNDENGYADANKRELLVVVKTHPNRPVKTVAI